MHAWASASSSERMTKLAPTRPSFEERVAADRQPACARFDLAQHVGDLAFGHPAADRLATAAARRLRACRSARRASPAAMCGTPAMMKMLPILMPGAPDIGLGISSAPSGTRAMRSRASVSPPRVGVIILEDRARLGMDDHRHAERRGDRVDGDVVVGRADAAGGEQIIVRGAQRVDRLGDPLLDVGHHAHFGQPDALDVQPARDLGDVLVLGAAREDLVADHDQRGGPDAWFPRAMRPPSHSTSARERLSRADDSNISPSTADDRAEARDGTIKLHGPEGFAGMRAAGRLAAEILDALAPHVVPGVTTAEIDDVVRRA